MVMFDIDFDHDLFLVYIEELHNHLFDETPLTELFSDVHNHHQKHHMVTLHLLKDKETFDSYYQRREELGIASIFDILIGALTENTEGDKIKEHLVKLLSLSPAMISSEPSGYDKKVLMKNLKSFMAYARKRKGVYLNHLTDKEDTN